MLSAMPVDCGDFRLHLLQLILLTPSRFQATEQMKR
jgi:hypothetical protein